MSEVPAHVPPERVVNFDYLNDAALAVDAHAAYLRLRDGPDLIYTTCNGGHWIGTRRELIAEVFQTSTLFSNFPRVIPKTVWNHKPQPFSDLDPPHNMKYRRLLQQVLSPKAVAVFEQRAREIMQQLADEVRPRGECDFAVDIAQKLPVFIIMRWLDLPWDDRFMLMENTDNLLSHADPQVRRAAKEATHAYVERVVNERRRAQGDDLISFLVNGAVDGRPVTHDEGSAMVANLVHGGLDTVRNMMSFFALFLARNAMHRRQLVEEPTLIPAAVEELLRAFAIANMARCVVSDTVFHGVTLKAGDMILLPTVLAGRDDRTVEQPDRIDFRRPTPRHVSFGQGTHVCPGMHLARIQLRVFLDEWLYRIPDFGVRPGAQPITRGGVILAVRSLPLTWVV